MLAPTLNKVIILLLYYILYETGSILIGLFVAFACGKAFLVILKVLRRHIASL